jgi:hypothetical protein
MVKLALWGLRIYLIVLLGLILLGFIRKVRKGTPAENAPPVENARPEPDRAPRGETGMGFFDPGRGAGSRAARGLGPAISGCVLG